MLDALQMPLIHKHHNAIALTLIDLLEKVLITFVYKDLLQPREEYISALNVPVDKVLINALLCESSWTSLCNLLPV